MRTRPRRRSARAITVETFPLVLTDPDDAFGLPTWPEAWREQGPFSDADIREWDDVMRSRRDGFRYAVDYRVVAATKP